MHFSEEEIGKIITDKIFALSYKKISSQEETLIESGILSSITVVELAVELEKTFLISFSFVEVNKENFNTAGAIRKLIQKKFT